MRTYHSDDLQPCRFCFRVIRTFWGVNGQKLFPKGLDCVTWCHGYGDPDTCYFVMVLERVFEISTDVIMRKIGISCEVSKSC